MLLKIQLDQLLWQNTNEIEIKKLWEYLCTYCYLPRLVDFSVLENTIREGLNSAEFFAYAAGIEDGRYVDLKFNQFVGIVDRSGYLVKVEAAKKQIADDEAKRQAAATTYPTPHGGNEQIVSNGSGDGGYIGNTGIDSHADSDTSGESAPTPQTPKNKRFFMSADLDTTRINRDVQKYVEEVISHLTSVSGANVKISLEVEVEAEDGFTQQIVRTVSENCRTLKVRDSGFEE